MQRRTGGTTFLRWAITSLALLVGWPAAGFARVEVQAVAGRPFGVGRMTVTLSRDTAGLVLPLVDDRFSLSEERARVLYPVFEVAPVRRVLRKFFEIDSPGRVTVYFLFQGNDPLRLTLHTPSPVSATVRPLVNERLHDRLLASWWREYTAELRRLGRSGEYPVVVENYLTTTLARRLRLELRDQPLLGRQRDDLDQAIGLILGAESVRAAMQKETLLAGSRASQPATVPLPDPVAPPPIDIPLPAPDVRIEPIAKHVPVECIYVRFGSFSNYLWLSDFLKQWGGNLANMIALRGLDYGENERLERQLSLKESDLAKVLGPLVIADVALVADDTFMREGAGFGILFQARNNLALSSDFMRQRQESLRKNEEAGAQKESLTIAGHEVTLLATPDNRVRSFYAVDGDFHFVTTSRAMVRRFYEAGSGKGALADSRGFQYARTLLPLARNDAIFAYLSDELFRKLVSPHYRVEMTRRMQSASEIQLLQLARLAARAEGTQARSIEELIRADLLPAGFGTRPDGSRLIERDGEILDSLRGAPGSFLPIADTQIDRITPSEAEAYGQFSDFYQSQWQQMDPVAVGIGRQQLDDKGLERMTLDVYVAPYAKQHYGTIANFLGAPTRRAVRPVEGDMLSLQMVTSGAGILGFRPPQPGGNHLFGGIRDFTPPLVVRQGEVHPESRRPELIRGYLGAWPRPGFLSLLLGSEPVEPDPEGYAPIGEEQIGWQRRIDEFLVLSFKREVLQNVTPQLAMVEADRPAQVRMRVADFTGSQLSYAVNAFGYMRARNTSMSGARFMNSLADQLHVPRDQCREVAEQILGAQLVCALGGEFGLAEHPDGFKAWTSSALPEENRFILSNVPKDYEFPMLSWFRGLQAELSLTDDVLSAHAEIDIQQSPPEPSSFQLPSLPGFSFPQKRTPQEPEELPPPKADK